MDNKKLWDSVLVEMELSLSKPNFNTWFKDTLIVRQEDGAVYLGVPNTFVQDWLGSKFHNTILRALRTLSPSIQSLHYIISKEDNREKLVFEKTPQITKELPMADVYINKEDNLNPRYTFETFVVGPFNEFAHAASQAIIKKPGIVYNPLFIYGGVGLGKTHLLQAIGHILLIKDPKTKILYTTCEKFTNDFVQAIRTGKTKSFQDKYRDVDLLIVDDIQFMEGKEQTQEQFFHTFNDLYQKNKQIVISSDRPPKAIPTLEDRLRSRFECGMIADIGEPDLETRIAIIGAKLAEKNYFLPEEIINHLNTQELTYSKGMQFFLDQIFRSSSEERVMIQRGLTDLARKINQINSKYPREPVRILSNGRVEVMISNQQAEAMGRFMHDSQLEQGRFRKLY